MTSFLSRLLLRPFSTATEHSTTSTSSTSSRTLTMDSFPEGSQKATLAAGCFWGVEHMFRKTFGGNGGGASKGEDQNVNGGGLLDAKVGYIGGDLKNPGYRAVCGGGTGHAEAVQLIYDPTKVTYRQLLEFFYRMHDPTTKNRQGPDRGSQYRSAIFYHDPEQEKVARSVTEKVNREWWRGGVVTEIIPAGEWYDAEKYHQLYLDRNPGGYECPSHYLRSFPPLSD